MYSFEISNVLNDITHFIHALACSCFVFYTTNVLEHCPVLTKKKKKKIYIYIYIQVHLNKLINNIINKLERPGKVNLFQ